MAMLMLCNHCLKDIFVGTDENKVGKFARSTKDFTDTRSTTWVKRKTNAGYTCSMTGEATFITNVISQDLTTGQEVMGHNRNM